MRIGKTLTNLRNKNHLTQQQVADALDIKRARYNAWENDISNPDLIMLKNIAEFYKVSVDFLLGKENENTNQADNKSEVPLSIKTWLRSENSDLTDNEKEVLAEDMEEYFKMRKAKLLKKRNEK
nr:helix-turn-helix domain-containing protein [Paenibacillus xylanexedens]